MNKKAGQRADGYANMLNKYGTPQDNSTAYRFQSEGFVPDALLTEHYEENGLFAKIIDAPAEEAIKHGFELDTEHPDAEQLTPSTGRKKRRRLLSGRGCTAGRSSLC